MIITELRKLELFVLGKMGVERINRMNDDMALFVELFSKAGKGDTDKNE